MDLQLMPAFEGQENQIGLGVVPLATKPGLGCTSLDPGSGLDPSQQEENEADVEAEVRESKIGLFLWATAFTVLVIILLFVILYGVLVGFNNDPYNYHQYTHVNMQRNSYGRFGDSTLDDVDMNTLAEELLAVTRKQEELLDAVNSQGKRIVTLQSEAEQNAATVASVVKATEAALTEMPKAEKCAPENDWAPGSVIDEDHTSPVYGRRPGQWFPWFNTPKIMALHGSEIVLAVGPVQRTHCFPFQVPGQIQIRLPHPIKVTGWGVSTLLSDTQPRRIRAISLPSGEDLGTLDVDRKLSETKQKVETTDAMTETSIVRLLVESSFGASYCCLYRIHVFGGPRAV